MQYRTHEDGPLVTIKLETGKIIISMEFDSLERFVRMHSHKMDHLLYCDKGAFRADDEGEITVFKAGDKPYLVKAHRQHGLLALQQGTMGRCEFIDNSITPERFGVTNFSELDGIPLDVLNSLTDGELI